MFKKMNKLRKSIGKGSSGKLSDKKKLIENESSQKSNSQVNRNLFNSNNQDTSNELSIIDQNNSENRSIVNTSLNLDESSINLSIDKEQRDTNINGRESNGNNLTNKSLDNEDENLENTNDEKPLRLIDDLDEIEENLYTSHTRLQREENLPSTVTRLEIENGTKVYLIGTIHFSEESCLDVEQVIRLVQPDVLVLEICKQRFDTLLIDEKILMQNINNFSFKKIKSLIKEHGLLQGLTHFLSLYSTKEIVKQTGMLPGSEIRRAFIEATKVPYCSIHLGDRPFDITLKRALAVLSLWEKIKIFVLSLFTNFTLDKEEIETFKKNDILEAYMDKLGSELPLIKQVIVDERDQYLAYSLQTSIQHIPHNTNNIYTKKLKESRNSLASVEQQLINFKHKLEIFKRVKQQQTNLKDFKDRKDQEGKEERKDQLNQEDQDIENYEQKFKNLQAKYNLIQEQVLSDVQNLKSKDYVPMTVVGVVGIGHVNGIVKHWGKVKESDIQDLLKIPEPSLETIILHKIVYYSFCSILTFCFIKYALPNTFKQTITSSSKKIISISNNFLLDKLFKLIAKFRGS